MQIISRDIGSIGESFSKYLVESIFFGNANSVTLYGEYKGALDFKFDYESNIDGNKTLRDIAPADSFGHLARSIRTV